jgi:hypothetical protein
MPILHLGRPELLKRDRAQVGNDLLLGKLPIALNRPSGILLSKIHHVAFDAHLIGIDPDYRRAVVSGASRSCSQYATKLVSIPGRCKLWRAQLTHYLKLTTIAELAAEGLHSHSPISGLRAA